MKIGLRFYFFFSFLFFFSSICSQNWKIQTSGIDRDAIWMLDESIGWIVGTFGAIFYTKDGGLTWHPQYSVTDEYLLGIWGADESNIWAVGYDGVILKYNGFEWSQQSSGTDYILLDVWGLDASNVWAVGYGGTVLKYDGTNWTAQDSKTTDILNGIWGQILPMFGQSVGLVKTMEQSSNMMAILGI